MISSSENPKTAAPEQPGLAEKGMALLHTFRRIQRYAQPIFDGLWRFCILRGIA
jgi:hypothetical protein